MNYFPTDKSAEDRWRSLYKQKEKVSKKVL